MDIAVRTPYVPLVIATALVAVSVFGGDTPVVTIESRNGAKWFGSMFAADGSTIVTVDVWCRKRSCYPILRFGSVDGNRVVEAEEELLSRGLAAIAVSGDTAVVRLVQLRDHELVIYTRDGMAWKPGQHIAVPSQCQADYYNDVHLEGDTMVVDSDMAWCIYRRERGTWSYDGLLRHDGGRSVGLSQGRIVELREDSAVVYERTDAGWRAARTIPAPPGEIQDWTRLAVSGRWFATRGHFNGTDYVFEELFVYEIATGKLVARLRPQEPDAEFVTHLAISDTTLVSIGQHDQMWRFKSNGWQPAGTLRGANTKGPPIFRHVAITDLIWIGNPAVDEGPCGGTVHGFR